MYPFQEQVDMLLIYGECQKNAVHARNLYAERYPDRNSPSRRTFINVYNKLRQTGSLKCCTSERVKPATSEETETDVLAMVTQNPHISTRQIERESGVSRSSVLRILHTST